MKNTLKFIILTIFFFFSFITFANDNKEKLVLKNDIAKVWPLVKIVRIEYDLTMARLDFCKSDKEREEYLHEYEDLVKQKYFKLVLGLNLRQGKLLLLLIHRELGQTPFDLIKHYLSYRKAIIWQSIAKLVGANLKNEYTPQKYPDIEQAIIIQNNLSVEM